MHLDIFKDKQRRICLLLLGLFMAGPIVHHIAHGDHLHVEEDEAEEHCLWCQHDWAPKQTYKKPTASFATRSNSPAEYAQPAFVSVRLDYWTRAPPRYATA
ncbi:MAG: hypothetical protein ACR2PW_04090 [Gammaproteobacteria bacterium]